MNDDEDEPSFGLVMPFVVCQSQGGAYEDQAFVAGVRMGVIQSMLGSGIVEHQSYEPPDLVPQLDLVAMDKGYKMTAEPYDDHWTLVTFVKLTA